ncbi:MAG: shikimate kinase [Candidatus Sumerlaeia bacterium]|nr:shikimate kinase [Candidatus Sumerlaeia bacterium]
MKRKPEKNNIILVGFMGTGKTEVGKALAEQLSFTYIDTDEIIEKIAGKSIPQIFSEYGEAHFRQLEKSVIQNLVNLQHHVIATGGGAVIFDENIENMKRAGIVICLTASPEVIYERIKHDTYRPLLQVPDPQQRIRELLSQRQAQYQKADFSIDTSQLTIAEVSKIILEKIKEYMC